MHAPVSINESLRQKRLRQWLYFSRKWGPRVWRGLMGEFTRPVAQSRFRPRPAHWNPSNITACWLGHASVLINFYGLTILTDPVLSRRIGLCVGPATLGLKRLIAPPLTVPDLPPIDLVLLSHAHMDHLHLATLNQFPSSTCVVTALATRDLLAGTRMKDIRELAWGDRTTITTRHGALEIHAFEVVHVGARWRKDKHRASNGYILERNNKKILFGGDTAYCGHFKKLRAQGPFEFAIMPIGSYKPGEHIHCTPEEAVAMANDAGAHYLLPVHHQTFRLGTESHLEPIERLERALARERIALREIGETFSLQ